MGRHEHNAYDEDTREVETTYLKTPTDPIPLIRPFPRRHFTTTLNPILAHISFAFGRIFTRTRVPFRIRIIITIIMNWTRFACCQMVVACVCWVCVQSLRPHKGYWWEKFEFSLCIFFVPCGFVSFCRGACIYSAKLTWRPDGISRSKSDMVQLLCLHPFLFISWIRWLKLWINFVARNGQEKMSKNLLKCFFCFDADAMQMSFRVK